MKIENLILKQNLEMQNKYNLIASENLHSKRILNALGSNLNYKYTEGYPGKRYYNGNKIFDKIELYCIQKAKELFKCKVANVQPLSGSIMNIALITNLLKNKSKILAMDLNSGGHLSHGASSHFIGKNFKLDYYSLNKKELIDYDMLAEKARKFKPKLIISGATSYSRKINFKKIGEIASEINAYHLADISHIAGLVVVNKHQSPLNYADFVTTTTHKTLRGPRGGLILSNNSRYEKIINKSIFPHFQGGTHPNIVAAKCICFEEALQTNFKKYISKVLFNTNYLCNKLKKNFRIVSNGTDNHLFLIDLSDKKFKGKEAADILENNNIIVNANVIPFDSQNAFNPSGIRLGLAFETTRGIKLKNINYINNKMVDLLS